MIYLDTSVALAELFAEDRRPTASLWENTLFSSRLLEYEMWTRIYAYSADETHGDAARELLSRINVIEMVPAVLDRALEPFPAPVRTLDALHLASIEFLRGRRLSVRLASYDRRMCAAAECLGIDIYRRLEVKA